MIIGTWTSKPANICKNDYVDLPTIATLQDQVFVAHKLLIFWICLMHKGVIMEREQIPSYLSHFPNRKTATLSYLQQSSFTIPLKLEKLIYFELKILHDSYSIHLYIDHEESGIVTDVGTSSMK